MITQSSTWNSSSSQQLASVLSAIDNIDLMKNFLSDVMTDGEIAEISARLQAAKMLKAGAKYTDIIAATRLSSRTVARISDWLQNGMGGYDAALEIINWHHDHILPARA